MMCISDGVRRVRPRPWHWRLRPWRWIHRARAKFGGYFWLPCALCGRFYGGHEWTDEYVRIRTGEHTGQGVCPWCARAIRRCYPPHTCIKINPVTHMHYPHGQFLCIIKAKPETSKRWRTGR